MLQKEKEENLKGRIPILIGIIKNTRPAGPDPKKENKKTKGERDAMTWGKCQPNVGKTMHPY